MEIKTIQRMTKSLTAGVDVDHVKLAQGILNEANKRAKGDKGMVEDLVQEGVLGLVKAKEKYDPEKGSFLTFARYWFMVAIRDYHRQECHSANVFRGVEGRKAYSTGFADPKYAAALRLDKHYSEGRLLAEVLGSDAPSPEDLFVTKERALAAQALVAKARNPREVATYAALMGTIPTMAEAAQSVGVSRQAIQQMSLRLIARGRAELSGVELS